MGGIKTFSIWAQEIHETSDQMKRLSSAKSAKTTPLSVDRESMMGIFPGSGASPYHTTLESCTCVDFIRRKLPCKHIYRLAIELGLLHESAQSGINKNVLKNSQITLADAVAEIENLSDDCQNFIKNFPEKEPIIFSVAENDPELLTCSILSTNSLDPQQVLEQMSKKEIMDTLKNNGHVPEKNMKKSDLISWCIETIPDIDSFLPKIVHLSVSPYAQKSWRKLHTYLRRKYDWEYCYLESEERGMETFLTPAESDGAGCLSTVSSQRKIVYSFPDDEITELLTLYGHNRCLNGFVIDLENTLFSVISEGKFDKKNFAITGTFDDIPRAGLSAIIEHHGGRVNEWITKNTAYLVVGHNAGSKLQRAKEKGVPLLSEQDFFALIN